MIAPPGRDIVIADAHQVLFALKLPCALHLGIRAVRCWRARRVALGGSISWRRC